MKNYNFYIALPYKVEIEYEEQDNSWFAYCPELGKGACYAIGASPEDALSLLEEEKKEYIKFLIKAKKSVPEPRGNNEELPSGRFIVRVPKTLHKKIQDQSVKEGVSLNQYVNSVLAESIGEKKIRYK